VLQPQPARPHAQSRFASLPTRAGSADACRQNHLLAALPVDEYEQLLPELERVPLPSGRTIYGAGDRERHLYFLTTGIVSQFHVTQAGASAEFAVTGSEGVIGIGSFLGGGRTPSEAVVLSTGCAYRLEARLLTGEFEHDGRLLQLLLRYVHALIAQTGQIAVCNRHHSLEQRLCRCILACLDRSPANELAMTHELIARTLGARRESVSESAARLQRKGLIRYHRGRIAVLDRPRLEALACECYAVVKGVYERLLPEPGYRPM
jgi:CRP-like cAMP-binding protein